MTDDPAVLVAVMALVTVLLRFLPFLIFSREAVTPPYISYLGGALPPAIIGMLVVYCLRDVSFTGGSYALPEAAAVLVTAATEAWRRDSLTGILAGTVVYMMLCPP